VASKPLPIGMGFAVFSDEKPTIRVGNEREKPI
jgi:hypothetical protein